MRCVSISYHLCALLLILAGALTSATNSAAATEKILYSFNPNGHGDAPSGGLIADAAGNLFGVTNSGGNYGMGAVYKFDRNSQGGWTETVLYSFKSSRDLAFPSGTLTFDSAGNLYGATVGSNPLNGGGVFELTPTSAGEWKETILHIFPLETAGWMPNGGLVFDHAGNLFGTSPFGVLFELTPGSNGKWTETTAFSFPSGSAPYGNLVFDSAGSLYGTESSYSSTLNFGAVFELSPSVGGGWTETILYAFAGGADGAFPDGGLIFDQAGNLYGTASEGGSGACNGNCGNVFKLTPASGDLWTEAVIYNFQGGLDAKSPNGNLIFDQAGNLYGTSQNGGSADSGTVFKLTLGADGQWSDTILWGFTRGADGDRPQAGVALGPQGQVYAAAADLGSFQHGAVIQLTPSTTGLWNEAALTEFPFTDGETPQASLIADAAGNLYGTTSIGGAYGNGTVFKLTKSGNNSWAETILYSFINGLFFTTGADPSALVFDSAGNLYGETASGGPGTVGTIFQLSPNAGGGWTAKNIFLFEGGSGFRPYGGLVIDQAGNLYGTTEGGGGTTGCPFGCGTVFELSPHSGGPWTLTVLYSFAGGSDGNAPVAGLVFDAAGNLYGTTLHGGDRNLGTVFELSPGIGGWTKTTLHRFTDKNGDGALPTSGLVVDQAGNLYGTTPNGGTNKSCFEGCGMVFELTPAAGGAWTENILLEFNGPNGANPAGTLVLDSASNLYGITQDGSNSNGGGIVFELSPAFGGAWTETVLHSFKFHVPSVGDGYFPNAGLLRDSLGNFFGTTVGGGLPNGGTVFEIIP